MPLALDVVIHVEVVDALANVQVRVKVGVIVDAVDKFVSGPREQLKPVLVGE